MTFESIRRYALVVATAVLVMSVTAFPAFANVHGLPITIGDLLNGETIVRATFSPTGNAFAFVTNVPASRQNTWGYRNRSLVRSRVYVAAPASATPIEIRNTADVRYSVAPDRPWSPNGQSLLLLATTRRSFGWATYSLVTGKIVRLPGYVASSFTPVFDWTPDGRIVYYSVPAGRHEGWAGAQLLKTLSHRWTAAWYGTTPQVTVSSNSPVFATSTPPVGALVLADPRDGTATTLSTGNYYAINVSPDGTKVAVVRGEEPLFSALNSHLRRGELEIIDLSAGTKPKLRCRFPKLDVSSQSLGESSMSWSPSGDKLLVVGRHPDSGHTNLYVVSARSCALQQLATPELSFEDPRGMGWFISMQVGWLGTQPLAVGVHHEKSATPPQRSPAGWYGYDSYGAATAARFDVYSFGKNSFEKLTAFSKQSVDGFMVPPGKHYAIVVADGDLWRIEPGHTPQRLTSPHAPTIVGFALAHTIPTPPPRSAYYHHGKDTRIGLYVLDDDGRPYSAVLDVRARAITVIRAQGDIIAVAPNQLQTLSVRRMGWASSLIYNGPDGRHVVTTLDGALKSRFVAPVKHFTFRYHGKTLNGWVVLPARPSGSPPPAVESVYGGSVYGPLQPPGSAEPRFNLALPAISGQLLATQGYAVIYPSLPIDRGATTNVMSTLAGEAVAAADALASEGLIDGNRVGVVGQSFGGFSTAAILAERSDRFKAGVAMAGIYGWIYGYGTVPMRLIMSDKGHIADVEIREVEKGQIGLNSPFWVDLDPYIHNSPIFRVAHINAPLLLLNGDINTGITGIASAERMYNAMIRAGKTVALVRYWGQDHVVGSAPDIRDQWARITAWFGYYLK